PAKGKPAPKKKEAPKIDLGPKPSDPRGAFFWTLKSEKISDQIIEAFEAVNPAVFFGEKNRARFYTDAVFPIGYEQTSDQIFSLARMISRLNPQSTQRILEVGTGSGFSTAVLSLLCKEVITVDIFEELAGAAKQRLYDNDYGNIRFYAGDATEPENNYGKIDGAIVHAACRKRPLPLLEEMVPGGAVVYPMGPAHMQQIAVMQNRQDMMRGENFITKFYETGHFSLIEGIFGYDLPSDGGLFGEAGEKEPPKSIESNPSLFEPPAED
ncbi:MAG: protein-L-isoaspartate O-methyltransferase family protein, partial [Spirochaetota bacterium]